MSIGFLLMFVFSQKTLYQGFQYSFFLFSYQLSISLLQFSHGDGSPAQNGPENHPRGSVA